MKLGTDLGPFHCGLRPVSHIFPSMDELPDGTGKEFMLLTPSAPSLIEKGKIFLLPLICGGDVIMCVHVLHAIVLK